MIAFTIFVLQILTLSLNEIPMERLLFWLQQMVKQECSVLDVEQSPQTR